MICQLIYCPLCAWHEENVILKRCPDCNRTHLRVVNYNDPEEKELAYSVMRNHLVDYEKAVAS